MREIFSNLHHPQSYYENATVNIRESPSVSRKTPRVRPIPRQGFVKHPILKVTSNEWRMDLANIIMPIVSIVQAAKKKGKFKISERNEIDAEGYNELLFSFRQACSWEQKFRKLQERNEIDDKVRELPRYGGSNSTHTYGARKWQRTQTYSQTRRRSTHPWSFSLAISNTEDQV